MFNLIVWLFDVIFFIYHTIFLEMQVKTSLATFPSSAEIVSEPLGVVLIISAWNYPFCMLISEFIFSFILDGISAFHKSL